MLIAILIKLESRGPVFFRQKRIGKTGDTFDMLKFRSMVDGADELKDDLRDLNEATDFSRSPTTRASPASAGCSGAPRSTSCPSCSTSSGAR